MKSPVSFKKLVAIAETSFNSTKNLDKLAEFGLDNKFFADFNNSLQKALNFQTHDDVKTFNKVKRATALERMKACYKWGRKIKAFMDRAYSADDPKLLEFPKKFDDAEKDMTVMQMTFPNVYNLAVKYQSELKAKGLSDALLAEGKKLFDDAQVSITDYMSQSKNSESVTVERRLLINKLYSIVTEINKVGRMAYEDDPVTLRLFDSPWGLGGSSDDEDDEKTDTEVEEKK